MENCRSRDPLVLKVLTQEFRDNLYQLKDHELFQILKEHPEERQRLERLLADIRELETGHFMCRCTVDVPAAPKKRRTKKK